MTDRFRQRDEARKAWLKRRELNKEPREYLITQPRDYDPPDKAAARVRLIQLLDYTGPNPKLRPDNSIAAPVDADIAAQRETEKRDLIEMLSEHDREHAQERERDRDQSR